MRYWLLAVSSNVTSPLRIRITSASAFIVSGQYRDRWVLCHRPRSRSAKTSLITVFILDGLWYRSGMLRRAPSLFALAVLVCSACGDDGGGGDDGTDPDARPDGFDRRALLERV